MCTVSEGKLRKFGSGVAGTRLDSEWLGSHEWPENATLVFGGRLKGFPWSISFPSLLLLPALLAKKPEEEGFRFVASLFRLKMVD